MKKLFLAFLLLPLVADATTINGVLRDININLLTTRVRFVPVSQVVAFPGYLEVGPPTIIISTNGIFSIELANGTYAVSFPTIPQKNPFQICVPASGVFSIQDVVCNPSLPFAFTNTFFGVRINGQDLCPDFLDAKIQTLGIQKILTTNAGCVTLTLVGTNNVAVATNIFLIPTAPITIATNAPGVFTIGASIDTNSIMSLVTNTLLPGSNILFSAQNSTQMLVSALTDTNMVKSFSSIDGIITTNFTTAQIQSVFDAGGNIWVQRGNYTITTNLYFAAGKATHLFMNGAKWSAAPNLTGAMLDTGVGRNNNFPLIVHDGEFNGTNLAIFASSAFFSLQSGSPDPLYNPHWANRTGIKVDSASGGAIFNNKFYGWDGSGILLVNSYSNVAYEYPRIEVYQNEIRSNFVGVTVAAGPWEVAGYYNNPQGSWPGGYGGWTNAMAEYQPLIRNNITGNYMGINGGAGNANFQLNMVNNNYIGLFMGAGINSGHGLYANNNFNHSVSDAPAGVSIWAEAQNTGGQFINNEILANDYIIFNSCQAIAFSHNRLGNPTVHLVFTNGCQGEILDTMYQGFWGTDVVTNFTGSSNRVVVACNFSENGSSDGSQCSQIYSNTFTFPLTNIQVWSDVNKPALEVHGTTGMNTNLVNFYDNAGNLIGQFHADGSLDIKGWLAVTNRIFALGSLAIGTNLVFGSNWVQVATATNQNLFAVGADNAVRVNGDFYTSGRINGNIATEYVKPTMIQYDSVSFLRPGTFSASPYFVEDGFSIAGNTSPTLGVSVPDWATNATVTITVQATGSQSWSNIITGYNYPPQGRNFTDTNGTASAQTTLPINCTSGLNTLAFYMPFTNVVCKKMFQVQVGLLTNGAATTRYFIGPWKVTYQ